MNKKLFCSLVGSLVVAGGVSSAEVINLPTPDKSSELMKIIDMRRSGRAYSDKKISEQELSNVLWSAFGTNSRGTRTIPTSRNLQNLKIFVVYNDKVWQYDGKDNKLNKISDENILTPLALQDFVLQAPVHLIYAGDKQTAEVHTGSAYENVSLYAAEKGLASVVRGFIDRDTLMNLLPLEENEIITYHQTLGYPSEK